MTNPFEGLSKKVQTLELKDGTKIKVKPKVKDVEMFITMKKEMTEKDAEKITQILKNMIERAYEGIDADDLDAFITLHHGELITKLAVLFGYTTEEKLEKMKSDIEKKALDQ